jgi:hypothetical protein
VATYLELTNSAILESGVEMDELTSVNFATTTDPLAKRFKRWVGQALKEIELERNEWEYKVKQAQTVIYPRFLVIDGDRSVAPPADSVFEADDTGSSFTVVGTTLLSGAWGDADAVALIDYLDLNGGVAWNDLWDETSPTPANLNVFRTKWFGRYDLTSTVADINEINKSSFSIQSASGLADTALNTGSSDSNLLQFVTWDVFNATMENEQQFGRPFTITETPEGWFDFFPRPNAPYILTFNYVSDPSTLTDWDDTVTDMPPLYQDMIVWRTVMYYADYDRKPDMFARAYRRYQYYKNRAESNLMPTVTFGVNRYNMPSRY